MFTTTTTATLPRTAVAANAIATNATTTASSPPSHSISMPLSSSSSLSSSSFLIPQLEWNILNMIYNNNIDNNTVMYYADTNNTNNDNDNYIDVRQLSFYEIIIYLNNISVTLLGTYNNYIAAIQTMKDTLSLLHNTTTASCNNNQNCIYEAYTRTIHTAAQRIIYEIQKQQQQQQQQLGDNATTNSSSPSSYYTTMNINEPKMNHIGVVVMSCYYSPNDAYYLLASIRTSKVAIYIDTNHNNNNNDYYHTNLHVIRSILVYNYGIAHRCCTTVPTTTTIVNNNNTIDQFVPPDNTKIGTFCLQIFQYAEQLLLPVIQQINEQQEVQEHEQENQMEHDQVSSEQSTSLESDLLLLYRFILTRNLMMISCKLGMSLCELYKETLDPIETCIVHSNTTNNNDNNDDVQLGLVQQQQQESTTTPTNTLLPQQPQQQQSNYHSSSNNNNNNVIIRHNAPIIHRSSNIQQQQDDYASAA